MHKISKLILFSNLLWKIKNLNQVDVVLNNDFYWTQQIISKFSQESSAPFVTPYWKTMKLYLLHERKTNGAKSRDPGQAIRLSWHRPAAWLQHFENTFLVTETMQKWVRVWNVQPITWSLQEQKHWNLRAKLCIPLIMLILLSILYTWMKQQKSWSRKSILSLSPVSGLNWTWSK